MVELTWKLPPGPCPCFIKSEDRGGIFFLFMVYGSVGIDVTLHDFLEEKIDRFEIVVGSSKMTRLTFLIICALLLTSLIFDLIVSVFGG